LDSPRTPGKRQHYVDNTPFGTTTLLDGFRLGQRMGLGSGARVCRAVRLSDGLAGVLKASTAAGNVEEWQREAGALRALQGHPCVCGLLDAFVDEAHVPIASVLFMPEYGPLPRFSLSLALHFLRELSDALEFLWRQRYVHGDIKPANVCSSGTRLVLCDFGTSRVADSSWVPDLSGTRGYCLSAAVRDRLTPARAFSVDQHALAVSVLQIEAGSALPSEAPTGEVSSSLDPALLYGMLHGRATFAPAELALRVL